LRGLLPENSKPNLKTVNDDNNKFYLLTADLFQRCHRFGPRSPVRPKPSMKI
jgi:hypothetical protein